MEQICLIHRSNKIDKFSRNPMDDLAMSSTLDDPAESWDYQQNYEPDYHPQYEPDYPQQYEPHWNYAAFPHREKIFFSPAAINTQSA